MTPSAGAIFHIVGDHNEETLYKGFMTSGPKDITTPSGGTHKCDETNSGANLSPGATLSTKTHEAGGKFGFD